MARRFQGAIATRNISLVLFFMVIFLGSGFSGRCQTPGNPSATREAQPIPNGPTGANRCVFCHTAEVEGYARSAMAHSLRRSGSEPDGTVTAGATKITAHSSRDGYWQRRENGDDKAEYRAEYVVGSGNHASGYLINLGGHLFQSPIAYYKSRQAYDLAPGYENTPDPDFTRPVSEECVLCHSGTALHVPGTLNQYRSPLFAAEGITCERCHGPVEKHLADPRAGTIVNPAKLERGARDSICEQCHLFGAARVPNPGKKLSDFVPGQRLEETYTIYHNAAPAGAPAGDFKVISHVEQLALSVCARNSDGRLWCGTCHDPHDKPAESVSYYRARCLSCHTASFPASHPSKDSDCLGCHMPRRDAKDGGHAAFTDHRIQRRPEAQHDLPAGSDIAAWREPSPDLQKRNLGIAYIDVGMQRHSSPFVIQGYRTLTEVQQQFRDDSDFFKWIGEALLLGKRTGDAKIALERALQLDPDSALTEASAASPYMQEGDVAGAIAHLERAVALDPLNLPVASTLTGLYQKDGKSAEAAALSNTIADALSKTQSADQTAQHDSGSETQKTAGEVYKNVRVLKEIPSGQLIASMQFMSSSLGVQCTFCHVEGHFEKDDKKPKQTARDMMQMMFALNKNSFKNQREITCYSCHRGAQNPVAVPLVGGETPNPNRDSDAEKLPGNLPTATQIIDNYIRALGGAAAIEKISSREEKGSAAMRGQSVGVEVFTKAPGKRTVVRHLPEGEGVTAFDGKTGWVAMPGRPTHDLRGAEIEAARMDADLQFPLHIQQIFPELRVEYPEKIMEREANVLLGIKEGQPSVKFYFDQQSGLLVRSVRYAESPLGLDPTQLDYGDYRDVDGIQVPFHITISEPGSSWSMQMREVRQNVQVDDAKFAKPPSDRAIMQPVAPK
jgi:photosynthetic reaction center cytochrome c subunit